MKIYNLIGLCGLNFDHGSNLPVPDLSKFTVATQREIIVSMKHDDLFPWSWNEANILITSLLPSEKKHSGNQACQWIKYYPDLIRHIQSDYIVSDPIIWHNPNPIHLITNGLELIYPIQSIYWTKHQFEALRLNSTIIVSLSISHNHW